MAGGWAEGERVGGHRRHRWPCVWRAVTTTGEGTAARPGRRKLVAGHAGATSQKGEMVPGGWGGGRSLSHTSSMRRREMRRSRKDLSYEVDIICTRSSSSDEREGGGGRGMEQRIHPRSSPDDER